MVPTPTLGTPLRVNRPINRILKQLPLSNLAFDAPTTLRLDEAAAIRVLLSDEIPVQQLQEELGAVGRTEGATIRASDEMEARLVGTDFKIQAVTPTRQPVSQGVTEWRWLAEPLEEGEKQLHLTLTALIGVDAVQFEYAVRTFERTLTVEAVPQSTGNRISDFLDENMQWIGPAVLIPLLAWAARVVWRRMRPARSTTGSSGAEPTSTRERLVPADPDASPRSTHDHQAAAGGSAKPEAVSEPVEVPPD